MWYKTYLVYLPTLLSRKPAANWIPQDTACASRLTASKSRKAPGIIHDHCQTSPPYSNAVILRSILRFTETLHVPQSEQTPITLLCETQHRPEYTLLQTRVHQSLSESSYLCMEEKAFLLPV
jgi:hypothetical protein